MEESYQETCDCDSVSESSFKFSENASTHIELNKSDTYSSEEAFISTVRTYAKQQGFQIRLEKSKKNAGGQIRKRTVVCSREGSPDKTSDSSNKRNYTS
jgi:hypothetical protein